MNFQSAWMTDELNKLLDLVPKSNHRKRRTTILRLAEAAATGKTQDTVWSQPECCSRKCWEGKYKDGSRLPGWRDDLAIQAALEMATRRAQWWMDTAEARRAEKRMADVARARDKLAELSPVAALKLGGLLGAKSEETARKAANDILDRADEATAIKGGNWRDTARDGGIDPDALVEQLASAILTAGDEADSGGGGSEGT